MLGKCKMPLLNHSTTIPLARTLAEIAKAVPVPVTFERAHGRVIALTFRYGGEFYRSRLTWKARGRF